MKCAEPECEGAAGAVTVTLTVTVAGVFGPPGFSPVGEVVTSVGVVVVERGFTSVDRVVGTDEEVLLTG